MDVRVVVDDAGLGANRDADVAVNAPVGFHDVCPLPGREEVDGLGGTGTPAEPAVDAWPEFDADSHGLAASQGGGPALGLFREEGLDFLGLLA